MADAPDPYIGRTLDKRYRIDRLIGRGGMGAVYEAHHIGLDRKVAVKFVLGGDADAKARFQREARAASKIDHDHVVHIYDVGVDDGVDFIAMEFVEGVDLKQALEAGPFEPPRALHVAKQLVAGLGAVHEAGVVHRDIKPANIMLTEHDDDRDFVKIMDFGISKAVDRSGTSITLAGRVVGTPAYMAPEQLTGDDADPRSDLYAAALVIYEMLAGSPPIRGDNTDQLVERRLREHPKRLDEVNAALPVALARVVDRALDAAPAQRYQTADAFLAALDVPLERGRLDSRTVAVRPMPASNELPTAQLTPATALERRAQVVTEPPGTPVETRPRWPLLLAGLLVLGVPLGVYLAMRTRKAPVREAVPVAPPPPIALDAAPTEAERVLAFAREADKAGRNADALASYRQYLGLVPDSPEAPQIVERIAALAPPAPVPAPPVPRKPPKPAKDCVCLSNADDAWLCKETKPACRCEAARNPLCPTKPASGPCTDMYVTPMASARVGMRCSGYMNWTSLETFGSIQCHYCPEQPNRGFRGHEGDACVGFNPLGGGRTAGTLRSCQ